MPLGAARFGLSGAELGKLELIQTITASADSFISFTSIDESIYNVHFLTFALTNFSGGAMVVELSNDGGSTYENSGYQRASQFGSVGGTFGEDKTTSSLNFGDFGSANSGNGKNGYMYMYNLGDSSKYSFSTYQAFNEHPTLTHYMAFGSAVRTTTEVNNAVRINPLGGFNCTGVASLYGIKES